MFYELKCVTCHSQVETELVRYGNGFVGVCPVCKELAYNSNELPDEAKGGESQPE